MANFCKQCTAEIFGEDVADRNDFTGLFKDEKRKAGEGYIVLCEGCGPCAIIDNQGTCGDRHCLKLHGRKCQLCDAEDDHAEDCPIRIATQVAYGGRRVEFKDLTTIREQPETMRDKFWDWWKGVFGGN